MRTSDYYSAVKILQESVSKMGQDRDLLRKQVNSKLKEYVKNLELDKEGLDKHEKEC